MESNTPAPEHTGRVIAENVALDYNDRAGKPATRRGDLVVWPSGQVVLRGGPGVALEVDMRDVLQIRP